jgi:hypothetical protein
MSRKSVLIAVFGLSMLLAVSAKSLAADITGVWRYEDLPGSEVTIAQDGNLIYICAHHGVGSGSGSPAAVISYGLGVIDGDKIKVQFKVVRRPTPTWGGSAGVTYEDLIVSSDGKEITGTWRNDAGQGAAARLVRVH